MASDVVCRATRSLTSSLTPLRGQHQQSAAPCADELRASSFLHHSFRSATLVSQGVAARGRVTPRVRSVAEPIQKEAVRTRVKRNVNLGKLQAGYLFPEVSKAVIAGVKQEG